MSGNFDTPEEELELLKRGVTMFVLEYLTRRPAEKPHFIALLKDMPNLQKPPASIIAQALLKELAAR